jgi:UDP-N-acetylglucosamine 3-dehydrogenase
MKKPVGIGVIGVGVFGENHARVYSELSNAKLVAVADVDETRAKQCAAKYGADAWYTDHNKLLQRTDIDAVSIATPDQFHREPAVAAAEAGKQILLEKPMASNTEDAEAILRAVEKAGINLMIGYILRFEIHYAGIKHAIDSGSIGRPIGIYSRMNCMLSEARYIKARVPTTLYMAVHNFDQMLWYLNDEPEKVHAEAIKGRIDEEFNTPDGTYALIRFRKGAVGCDESLWCLPDEFGGKDWKNPKDWRRTLSDLKMQVIGTDGALWLDYPPNVLRGCDQEGWKYPQMIFRPVVRGRLGGALREEISHFAESVIQGTKPRGASGPDGLKSLKIALAVNESVKTGKTVSLD